MAIEDTVPRAYIEAVFGGIMAISPVLMKRMVDDIADKYKVEPDELRPYISKVLSEMPPWPDDF